MKTVFCVVISAGIAAIPAYVLAYAADLAGPTFALCVLHASLTVFATTAFRVFSE